MESKAHRISIFLTCLYFETNRDVKSTIIKKYIPTPLTEVAHAIIPEELGLKACNTQYNSHINESRDSKCNEFLKFSGLSFLKICRITTSITKIRVISMKIPGAKDSRYLDIPEII